MLKQLFLACIIIVTLFPILSAIISAIVSQNALIGLQIGGAVHLACAALAALGTCIAWFVMGGPGGAAQMGRGIYVCVGGAIMLGFLVSGLLLFFVPFLFQ